MAGHRRGSDKPLKGRIQHGRRRARLDQELAAAVTPRERIGVAADYLRGAMARRPHSPMEHLVKQLIAEADRLYRQRRHGEEG